MFLESQMNDVSPNTNHFSNPSYDTLTQCSSPPHVNNVLYGKVREQRKTQDMYNKHQAEAVFLLVVNVFVFTDAVVTY